MKQFFLLGFLVIVGASCSNFTDEQRTAAKFVCDCIETDEYEIGDPKILYHICFEKQAKEKFDKSVFEGDGFANALFKTCPEQNLVTEK